MEIIGQRDEMLMNRLLLVINVGSTSVKIQAFNASLQVQALLAADYGHLQQVLVDGRDLHGRGFTERWGAMADVAAVLMAVLGRWRQWLATDSLALAAIGHRIVHGADWFDGLTPISPSVMQRLEQLDAYAPLHNPFNRLGIQIAADLFPGLAQFALFDTAFHRHLPDVAKHYAIPKSLSGQLAFYRYGFHGLSCQHSLTVAAQWLGRKTSNLNLIVLHLGGGASVTAIRAGVSVDTSMGFSPTEGLLMAGRCGDIDPMILLALQRQGMALDELDDILNHRSGLKGICGETDMRSILRLAKQGDANARLAIDMFCYRIKKYIGAYCAILGEVSALVFTGGIGAHSPEIRAAIINGLEPLGFALSPAANQSIRHNGDIAAGVGRPPILVIHAEEELVCAKEMLTFLDSVVEPVLGSVSDNQQEEA